MKLTEIPEFGDVPDEYLRIDLVRSAVDAMVGLYRNVGFHPPWVGYVAAVDGVAVGLCGFKSPPVGGRVEIAYGTLDGYEGRGIATRMAAELVRIARQVDAGLVVFAQTLPEENASTTILKKLGFRLSGAVEHPEDGTVWEWVLEAPAASPAPNQ